ncbi:MAG TPA: helix-turn-helix transcriptional regulator [Thermomicrobiales bacterium]|nr:helix-turn-helix transcriptional regulator [Thermomicrobiales bacterium]
MSDEQRFTVGSGNIYADLGFEEPELEEAKASLARQIGALIKERRLTQVQAANILGIDQPKVSALVRGRLGNFSTERLMKLLTRLGQDVEITVQPAAPARQAGRIAVHYADHGMPMAAEPAKKGKADVMGFS